MRTARWAWVLTGFLSFGCSESADVDAGAEPAAEEEPAAEDGSSDASPDAGQDAGQDVAGPDEAITPDEEPAPDEEDAADPGPPPEDDARIVAWDFPTVLHQGQTYHASITVANVGTATWTEAAGYRLGTVDDSDPFYDDNRVRLAEEVSVPGDPANPGTVTFRFLLRAYQEQGTYVSDWRMLKELEHWFGETLTLEVQVVEPYATCIEPVPPPLERFNVVLHSVVGERKTLDSTPLVYGREYCTEIGFTDYRSFCPPRPEGHPQVEVCNEAVVGHAADTGRIGPTWTFDGLPCDVTPGENVCENHSTNQFLVRVWGTGTARACAATNGVCGELLVE